MDGILKKVESERKKDLQDDRYHILLILATYGGNFM